MEHPNAEIFRAIADGRASDVVYTAPWMEGEWPITCCSANVILELHNPGSLIPPGIKFHIKAASND